MAARSPVMDRVAPEQTGYIALQELKRLSIAPPPMRERGFNQ